MRGTIFIAGAHGVSKTSLVNRVSDSLGIPSYTASDLINMGDDQRLSPSTKVVIEPNNNQEVLIQTMNDLLEHMPPLLVDGHTALFTSDN